MHEFESKIVREVEEYYSARIQEYGQSPKGVDWNGEESQFLRFTQLMKIVDADTRGFSVADVGCGYGALVDYLKAFFDHWSYYGIDVSPSMIQAARERYATVSNTSFAETAMLSGSFDYVVASGVFNVRLQNDDPTWWQYLTRALDMMHERSTRGFSFNCLTMYSDAPKMRGYLYYADPCRLFDWCKNKYSRNVALLHDYGLYEFTILVRKK